MAAKFQKLEAEYQHLLAEYNILKCKLECKTDALLILSHEQAQCCSERDQYKLMAEQLRERYSALRKRVEGWGPSLLGAYDVQGFKGEREQSLVQLLCEVKEQNKSLQHEVDDLKLKLSDAHGDIKILREELARSRSNSLQGESPLRQLSLDERENLVKQLETFRHKCTQLERDLEAILDEKEELVTARDAYRHKFERLNQQLNCLLRGDQPTYVDIDGVIMENRYLQERVKQVIEEKNMALSSLSKCQALLEKKRVNSGFQLSSIASGLAVSAKQVEHLLQNNHFLDKVSNSTEFRNLLVTLLEALSDKALALSHQKKTNKLLGNRVSELEQKIKALEAANLWKFRDGKRHSYLFKGGHHQDDSSSEELTPQHSVNSVSASIPEDCISPVLPESVLDKKALNFDSDKFPVSEKLGESPRAESSFSDLDLLPTKEYSRMNHCRKGSLSSNASSLSGSRSSTPAVSPLHRTHSTHSDSELSPKKSLLRMQSNLSLQNSPVYRERDPTVLDAEELPPKLQELLIAALAELDESSQNEKEKKRSPKREVHFSVDNPNC